MRGMCCQEKKEFPRDDPRFAVAIVLRNLMRLLMEQGVLEAEQMTELGLESLRECLGADDDSEVDLATIDFVWSVFPKGLD